MTVEQGGSHDDHGTAQNPLRVQEQRRKPQQELLAGTAVGCPLAITLDDQQFVFQEQILGDNRLAPVGPKQRRHRHYQMRNSVKRAFISGLIYTRIINSPCTSTIQRNSSARFTGIQSDRTVAEDWLPHGL